MKDKHLVIEKNTGSIIFVHPNDGGFASIIKRWEEAHKKDEAFTVEDVKGNLHRVNSHRIIDIFEGTLDQPKKEKEEEKEDLNLDQT